MDLTGGLGLNETIEAFNKGLGNGATIALSYAMLGTFAVAISKSGITDLLSNMIIKKVNSNASAMQFIYIKYMLLALVLFAAISSQNISTCAYCIYTYFNSTIITLNGSITT